MRDLQELYDAVDLAIASGERILPEERLAAAAHEMQDIRNRRGHIGDTLVVAIAGGTGSGKSSLLNAIAGSEVASTSRLRPHTDRPLAWVPSDDEGGVARLLDDLAVDPDDRHRHDVLAGVALIDLPDMDSTRPEHRRAVERLLPKVDALLWVLDPEKYRDPEIHQGFLEPLSHYAEQTVFVLNKCDLLDDDGIDQVARDLEVALIEDGYSSPRIFCTVADPSGTARGIDELVAYFDAEIDRKMTAQGKLVADVAGVIRRLGAEGGVWNGASVRWEERWARARDAAVNALIPGASVPSEDALCRIEDLVAAVASEVDPVTAHRLRERGSAIRIREAAVAAQEISSAGAAGPGEILDHYLEVPLAEVLRRRSHFAGTLAYAAVGARQLAERRGLMSW